MTEGPNIPQRIDRSAPPTDLPDTQLSYPGKPLSHRYLPAEKSRKVEEESGGDLPKLASDSSFSPVSSLNYGDRSIHLGSVSNTRKRHLTPVGVGGSVTVPKSTDPNIALDEKIHKPVAARLQQATSKHTAPVKLAESKDESEVQTNQEARQDSTEHSQNFLTEIQKLKEQANAELAKRGIRQPAEVEETIREEAATPSPQEQPTELRQQTEGVAEPVLETAPPPPPRVDQEEKQETKREQDPGTKHLLEQAEQLEQELNQLRAGIAHKEEEKEQRKVEEANKIETYEAQIAQLTADRESLSSKVAELTDTHSQELAKRKELEQQINQAQADYQQRLKTAEEENTALAQIQDQQKQKISALEQQVQQIETDFQTKLQQIAEEKTNLEKELGQLKEADQSDEKIAALEKELHALSGLREQLDSITTERDNLKDENSKLQKLVEELKEASTEMNKPLEKEKPKEAPKQERPETTQVSPEPTAPVKEDDQQPPDLTPKVSAQPAHQPGVKVVKPQAAVGRMAPSLTTSPNVINGIVKNSNGMLLSNVIIVVKDENGQPVRALKSNKIGQFAISTPLPNGTYTMELESEGKSFDVLQVDVEGKVMPPIEIRAH